MIAAQGLLPGNGERSSNVPKRIYVGLKDPRKAKEIAQRTGIDLSRLQQAAAGKLELSPAELEKVTRGLGSR